MSAAPNQSQSPTRRAATMRSARCKASLSLYLRARKVACDSQRFWGVERGFQERSAARHFPEAPYPVAFLIHRRSSPRTMAVRGSRPNPRRAASFAPPCDEDFSSARPESVLGEQVCRGLQDRDAHARDRQRSTCPSCDLCCCIFGRASRRATTSSRVAAPSVRQTPFPSRPAPSPSLADLANTIRTLSPEDRAILASTVGRQVQGEPSFLFPCVFLGLRKYAVYRRFFCSVTSIEISSPRMSCW